MMKRYLTEPEQALLLKTAHRERDPLAQRDYWWMRLLIETGARVGEFSQWTLTMAEEAQRTGWLIVPKAMRKGKRADHEYLVTESVRQCLQALCFMARTEAQEWLDVQPVPLVWGRDGAPLSVRSYQDRFKYWAGQAQLHPGASLHWLRHTRGMNIMRRSRAANAVKVAQQALGHSRLSSTGVYLTMSREELADELARVDTGRLTKRQAKRRAAAQGVRA